MLRVSLCLTIIIVTDTNNDYTTLSVKLHVPTKSYVNRKSYWQWFHVRFTHLWEFRPRRSTALLCQNN